MRLGLLGGSFDPVHYGHLLLAECAREQCALDQVWFLPAAVPPHKQDKVLAGAEHRVEMLKLAIGGHEAFGVCMLEIERGGLSYSVDTLEQLQRDDPARELFFIMGGDSLADLPTWHRPERFCELAVPLVVRRAGSPEPDYRVLEPFVSSAKIAVIRELEVKMPLIEISSREIRARVANQQSIRYRTPRAVEEYIRSNGLYAI
jgi:nicotinate-nucleotide adenylyltransferase